MFKDEMLDYLVTRELGQTGLKKQRLVRIPVHRKDCPVPLPFLSGLRCCGQIGDVPCSLSES